MVPALRSLFVQLVRRPKAALAVDKRTSGATEVEREVEARFDPREVVYDFGELDEVAAPKERLSEINHLVTLLKAEARTFLAAQPTPRAPTECPHPCATLCPPVRADAGNTVSGKSIAHEKIAASVFPVALGGELG